MSQLTRSSQIKLLMPVLYLAASLVFFVLMLNQIPVQVHHVVGIGVTLVAFALWITARIQLGDSFTIAPEAKELVTRGLYSKLRHPVYYFSVLAVFGLTIFIWNAYALIILIVLVTLEVIRIREEEKVLARAFGKQYRNYQKSTWF